MIENIKCPKCREQKLDILQETDFDNNTTYYYPKCKNCGFTSKSTFSTEELCIEYLALIKEMEIEMSNKESYMKIMFENISQQKYFDLMDKIGELIETELNDHYCITGIYPADE